MDKYIETDKLLEKARETQAYFVIKGLLCGIPAADVEPVRHGRWEYVTNVSKTRGWFACSKCGSSPPYKASGIRDTKATYCPNCGAKMDGEA